MHKRLRILVCLFVFFIFLAGLGLLHAGYNYRFEPEDIIISDIEKTSKGLKISVDYCTSAKVIKHFKYTIVDHQLIIQLYGGWIYPWDKGITAFSINAASGLYDQVIVKGRKSESVVLSQ